MSPSGLRSFLLGGEPYEKSRRKLVAWYVTEQERRQAGVTPEAAAAAISLLTQHLPQAARTRIKKQLIELLTDAIRQEALSPPAWLTALERRTDGEASRDGSLAPPQRGS